MRSPLAMAAKTAIFPAMAALQISAPQDSGNITVLSTEDPSNIRLAITKDGAADFFQWFYFRVSGAKGRRCDFAIENAGASSYLGGWKDYKICCSYDLQTWFRLDTTYREGVLRFSHEAQLDSIYFAYFAPYPIERYRSFVAEVANDPLVDDGTLGATLDGEPLDYLRIGSDDPNAPEIWVIARQHPGETMGSWWMEGFLPRLLDPDDAVATALRRAARFHVVPLVNIDGARRGHLRTNAAGIDLNRQWASPSMEKSPEVFLIRQKMDETGVDLFLDVHGDETIPNNFIAGAEGIPNWTDGRQRELDTFISSLKTVSPAFQDEQGYPKDAPGSANLAIAANGVAARYDCLSMTLEMPFKDANVLPDPVMGWSPDRCADLGRACLDAIWMTLPTLDR